MRDNPQPDIALGSRHFSELFGGRGRVPPERTDLLSPDRECCLLHAEGYYIPVTSDADIFHGNGAGALFFSCVAEVNSCDQVCTKLYGVPHNSLCL